MAGPATAPLTDTPAAALDRIGPVGPPAAAALDGVAPASAPATSATGLGRRLSASLAWNLASDLAARGASLWLSFFCARLLGVAGFGLFAFGQGAAQYAWLFGDAALNCGYATRELSRAGDERSGIAPVLYAARLIAGLLLAILFLAAVWLLPIPAPRRALLSAASIFFVAYASFPDWAARGIGGFRSLALANLASALTLVAVAWSVLPGHPSPALALGMWAASFAVGGLVLVPALGRRVRLWPPPPRLMQAWLPHFRRSSVFALGGFLAVGIGLLPTVLLGLLAPAREVGLFAAAFRLVSAGLGLAAVIWWPIFPVLSNLTPGRPEFARVLRLFFASMLGFSLPAAIALGFFPAEIMTLLFGREYAAGAGVLRLVAWCLPVYALVTVLEITLLATGGEARRARILGVTVAVLAAAGALLMPRFGALGAASSLLLALAVAATGFAAALRGALRATGITGLAGKIAAANLLLAAAGVLFRSTLRLDLGWSLALGVVVYAALALGLGILPPAALRTLRRAP